MVLSLTDHLPEFDGARVDAKQLRVVFNDTLDPDHLPAAWAFTVTATPPGGNARTIRGSGTVEIDGAAVSLTLASAVAFGEEVTLAYAKPRSNPLRNLQGIQADSFSDRAVHNPTEAPPVVQRAVISQGWRDHDHPVGPDDYLKGSFVRTAWTYRVDRGGSRYPTDGSFDAADGTITLTFSSPVTWTESLTVRYQHTGSVSSRLRNRADTLLAAFSNQKVRRYTPPNAACTFGPGPDKWFPDSPCGTGPQRPHHRA